MVLENILGILEEHVGRLIEVSRSYVCFVRCLLGLLSHRNLVKVGALIVGFVESVIELLRAGIGSCQVGVAIGVAHSGVVPDLS